MNYRGELIWVPNSEIPLEEAVDNLWSRIEFMNRWLQNDIDTAQFLDAMDECRINVFDLVNHWDKGDIVV